MHGLLRCFAPGRAVYLVLYDQDRYGNPVEVSRIVYGFAQLHASVCALGNKVIRIEYDED